MDRGIWRMLPLKLNEGTWAKLESFPSLAHVIISLIVAMNSMVGVWLQLIEMNTIALTIYG